MDGRDWRYPESGDGAAFLVFQLHLQRRLACGNIPRYATPTGWSRGLRRGSRSFRPPDVLGAPRPRRVRSRFEVASCGESGTLLLMSRSACQ